MSDLDASDASCTATTATKSYLQRPRAWSNFDKDPSATAGFGIYGSQPSNFIFQRENF